MPMPRWVEPQLAKLVEKARTGPQWVHEIKFEGYRMAARIERGKVQLLTRSRLDWTEKYPATAAAFARLLVKTAYIDGELCGVRAGSGRQMPTTPLPVVGLGDERPVPIFQQLARGHPLVVMIYGAQWAASRWAAIIKDFPPIQKPNTLTLEQALAVMHETAAGAH